LFIKYIRIRRISRTQSEKNKKMQGGKWQRLCQLESVTPNIRSAMTTFVLIVAEKSMETIQVDVSIQGMMLNSNT
jgi:hypothetical protein